MLRNTIGPWSYFTSTNPTFYTKRTPTDDYTLLNAICDTTKENDLSNEIIKIIANRSFEWHPDHCKDSENRTLLMHAVANGNIVATKALLERGADREYKSDRPGVNSVSKSLEVLKHQANDDLYREMESVLCHPIKPGCSPS